MLDKSSKLCAGYIIKNGDYNYQHLPHDVWVRFVNKKIREFN